MTAKKLVNIEDMSRAQWDEFYARCCDIYARPDDYTDACKGKILATLFYEPSTRTSFSFQAAMQRLGGGVFGFSDPMGSSVAKGETLADTIRIAAAYSDTIVLRSPLEGAAAAASLYSDVPLINAGDGGHFHPTQTLADLTTIAQKRGGIKDFRIGLCGDLKYGRTVHSLVSALSMFPGISFYLISPRELKMPDYVKKLMLRRGQDFTETVSLVSSIPELDVLYMTRVQRERFSSSADYEKPSSVYVLNRKMLSGAKPDLLLMHPLPRVGEIRFDVDCDPRAVYFEQARFGMFIRMALLLDFCHSGRIKHTPLYCAEGESINCSNPNCVTRQETYLPNLPSQLGADTCPYCDKDLEGAL